MKSLTQFLEAQKFLIKGHTVKQNSPKIDEIDKQEILDYLNSRFWEFPEPDSNYYKIKYTIGKDNDGYYIDTEDSSNECMRVRSNMVGNNNINFMFDENIDKFNKYDWKHCPKFRWRKHKGIISIKGWQKLDSLLGLPEEIDTLFLSEIYSKTIDLGSKHIKKIRLHDCLNKTLQGTPTVDEITWLGSSGRKPAITFNCKNMHKE